MELSVEITKNQESSQALILEEEQHFVAKKSFYQKILYELKSSATFAVFFTSTLITIGAIFYSQFSNPAPPGFRTHLTPEGPEICVSVMSLFALWTAAFVLGRVSTLARMPPLLGMLLAGIVLRNIELRSFQFAPEIGTFLRKFAFVIILLRAGLGLDPEALKRLKGVCVRLSLLPCSFEALAVGFSSWIMFGFRPIYGLLLGFVLAAVSPAVVVPGMLDLQKRNLGVEQGIPTLVTAAASMDDVYAITIFSSLFSMLKSPGTANVLDIGLQMSRAVAEVLAGCIIGSALGLLQWIIPGTESGDFHFRRTSLLAVISSAVFFGSIVLGVDSLGPIAVLVSAFVAAIKWRNMSTSIAKKSADSTVDNGLPQEKTFRIVWEYFAQPFLFSLIGYQLQLDKQDSGSVLIGLLVLLIGLVVRTFFAFISAFGTSLNVKERLFVAIAWLPKATVQAALAPVLLDLVDSDPKQYRFREEATVILTVAVLSILLTAPIGALLIRILAPLLIKRGG
ncbi:sodium/hydrogen exchanger family domain-containing protein [Ditylenchus destructor]|uniref:Sodium/hydrogen exchanger family domain-containing protein n=1 Tax=Ditylenchus destructor TaxID=166010 RepID=A0AAD4MSD1_9BILA|nr:sodium/hydrogen exchanger family domain-containing protein [Ditylenchus destructor]